MSAKFRSDAVLLVFASTLAIRSDATLLIFASTLAINGMLRHWWLLLSTLALRSDAARLILASTRAIRSDAIPHWSLLVHLHQKWFYAIDFCFDTCHHNCCNTIDFALTLASEVMQHYWSVLRHLPPEVMLPNATSLIFASTLAITSDATLLIFASTLAIWRDAAQLIFASTLAIRSNATVFIYAARICRSWSPSVNCFTIRRDFLRRKVVFGIEDRCTFAGGNESKEP